MRALALAVVIAFVAAAPRLEAQVARGPMLPTLPTLRDAEGRFELVPGAPVELKLDANAGSGFVRDSAAARREERARRACPEAMPTERGDTTSARMPTLAPDSTSRARADQMPNVLPRCLAADASR